MVAFLLQYFLVDTQLFSGAQDADLRPRIKFEFWVERTKAHQTAFLFQAWETALKRVAPFLEAFWHHLAALTCRTCSWARWWPGSVENVSSMRRWFWACLCNRLQGDHLISLTAPWDEANRRLDYQRLRVLKPKVRIANLESKQW